MKIKTVTGDNVKGRKFNQELAPATLIAGRNKTGKTSIIKAIELAVLGYDAKRGQTNAATFKLAGQGNLMSASVILENGQSLGHVWKQDKKGSVSMEKTGTLRDEVPYVALDAVKYFGLGAKARVDYIFENARTDGLTTVQAILDSIVSARLEFTEPVQQAAIDGLLISLRKLTVTAVQDWIEQATEAMDTAVKNFGDEVNRFKGANQAAVQLSTEDTPKRPSHVVETDIKTANDSLIEHTSAKLSLEGQIRVADTAFTDRANLRRRIEQIGDQSALITRLEEELVLLAAELADYNPKEGDRLGSELHALRQRIVTTGNAIGRETAAKEKAVKEIEELRAATSCPTCKSSNDSWQSIVREKIDSLISDIQELENSISVSNTVLLLDRETLTASEKQLATWNTASSGLKTKTVRRQTITQSLLPNAMTAQTTRQSLIDRLNEGKDPEPTEGLRNQLVEVKEKIDTINLKRDELSQELKLSVAEQQDEIRREDAVKQQKLAALALEAAKRVQAIIKEKRSSLVSLVFDGLMGRINQIAAWVTGNLIYRDGEIGKLVGERFVSQETFSGTEQAVTFAAVSVALASTAPFKLVILDEMGRLDAENKRVLVSELIRLIEAETIDQFIGVDTSAEDYKRFARKDSFKVIELAPAE